MTGGGGSKRSAVVRSLRRHWVLLVLLTAGLTLRVLSWLAYQPALLYIDSFRYLGNLETLNPAGLNPIGYDVILKALLAIGNLQFVAAVQHLLGMALAVALYALALRHRVPRLLAALVAAVPLLDAYQVQIEQHIMSEIWFQAVLVGLMWVLLARGTPNWRRALLAGVLIALGTITRTIGIVVAVPVIVYLVTSAAGFRTWPDWRRLLIRVGVAVAGLSVIVGAYAGYFRSETGRWGIGGAGTNALYGRTATIADCDRLPLTDELELFCPEEPLGERRGVDWYAHQAYGNKEWPEGLPEGADKAALATEFGKIVIRHQTLDLVAAILKDTAKNFSPVKKTFPNDVPIDRWQFQTTYPRFPNAEGDLQANRPALRWGGMLPTVNEDLARFLRSYQLHGGYTPGPLLAVLALAGVAGTLGIGRARRSGLRSAAMVSTGSGLALLLGSAAFEFSWRYELPALMLLPIGGVIGLTALLGRGRHPELDEPGGEAHRVEDMDDQEDPETASA